MAALGRILQAAGWLWVIAGIIGPIFGLSGFNVFPGIIALFIARILRNQAVQKELPDLGDQAEEPEPTPPRMMNTERRRTTPPPAPGPVASETMPEPAIGDAQEPEADAPARKRNELLEQIVLAGREAATEEAPSPMPNDEVGMGEEEKRGPMSSEEMIARAHRRWDSKRR